MIYNVIVMIIGREEFDCYVFLGNYCDVWVFGVVDVLIGIFVLLEISRVLMKLVKQGWRFWRIIKVCSFGVEEFGFMGFVEWLEENFYIFKECGVVYLNIDVFV